MPTGAETDPNPSLRDPFASDRDQTEYDAIAELFLGDASTASPTPRSAPSSRPGARMIETVILGHLPGAASAWVVQYAGAVASTDRAPVALLRVAEGEVSIEIIGDTDALSRVGSLDEALAVVRDMTSRVLVRTDELGDEIALRRVDAITILTGADDAAVVGAYRMLKSHHAEGRLAPSMQIRAAVMGAEDAAADRAIEQLRRAVAEFLSGHLTQAPNVRRIGPVHRATVYRGAFHDSAASIIEQLRAPAKSVKSTGPAPVTKPEALTSAPPANALSHGASPAETPAPTVSSPALASRVPNLIALESRCPYHESIELAAGMTGELHALTQGSDEHVGDLLAVESWARDHAKLLAKAEPALRAMDGDAALHLFSDQPAKVRHLLNTRLRVHILAKPGPDGLVCLPLNHAD